MFLLNSQSQSDWRIYSQRGRLRMIKWVYTDYVQDILDSINDIESFIKGMDFKEFYINKLRERT